MNQPLANIHPNAQIANNVTIEPFVSIHEDVVIGEGTKIMSNVVIMNGARIGKNVTIFPSAVISAIPQDLKYKGEETTTIIGDNTIIREFVTINRGTAAKGKTIVGNNCFLMAYSHVAHDCILGKNIILANTVQLAGEVEVDDFAILGGGVLVHQFVKIGAHAMLQGGLLATKDIPPYIIAGRLPASYAGVNSIGLRRRGFSNEEIIEIQDIYRILFNSDLNFSQAREKIAKLESESIHKKTIVDFLNKADRGIIPGYKK